MFSKNETPAAQKSQWKTMGQMCFQQPSTTNWQDIGQVFIPITGTGNGKQYTSVSSKQTGNDWPFRRAFVNTFALPNFLKVH